MDIVEFFRLSAGKWGSIKSQHHVDVTQQQSGRSTIDMELLDPSHPDVVGLCQTQNMTQPIACAARVNWDGTLDGEAKKQTGSLLLVAIAAEPTASQGQLLRSIGADTISLDFQIGEAGDVTLTQDHDKQQTIERIWFESDNVRLRHTKIVRPDGSHTVAFCSEVRMIAK